MGDIRDISITELAERLADDIEDVVRDLSLDVVRTTPRKLVCSSPYGKGKTKLEIELRPVRGKWNDWSEGRYGDALGLVGYVLGHPDPKSKAALHEGIRWAKDYYGLEASSFDRDAWDRKGEEVRRRAEQNRLKAQRELAQQRKTALGIWLASEDMKPGHAGWDYLAARGIDLRQLPRRPGSIKFSRSQEWRDDDQEVRHVGPAIMSAMSLPNGEFGSLHRIWIDPDRPGEKADLSHIYDKAPPRKMWPSSEGCAIRVWRGESGLPEKEAAAKGRIEDLIICEGVEDGLSIALMTPEYRVVAAGSLPGLLSYVPSKHIRAITVAADNDWVNPQAVAMLDRALLRLTTEYGKLVRVARSPEGKDFNDLLRERGAE